MKNPGRDEVFILTTEPLESLGGMERFLNYLSSGLRDRGFEVRVFHRENSAPARWQHSNPVKKGEWFIGGVLQGYFVRREAKKALHSGVRLVLSNSTVGWFPLGNGVRQAHFYHGTYRGQAESIRPYIRWRGYLKLKWWDAMVLERLSGRNRIVLCCSEPIQREVRHFFGYQGQAVWYPIDLRHFHPLDQEACRRQLGIPNVASVGLFVGSTHPMKGFPLVEHLIRMFPRVTWLLALRGQVPEEIRSLHNVRVFPDAAYDLLPLLYNAADFSLCPSRYDPFPYVVAEALACGTPVIASPHGASLTFHKGTVLEPLMTTSTDDWKGFEHVVRLVLTDSAKWRLKVLDCVRPHLEELMAPENWWPRFFAATGLVKAEKSSQLPRGEMGCLEAAPRSTAGPGATR